MRVLRYLGLTTAILLAICTTAEPCAATPTAREFGAVGDGQADDTAALQAAVDAGRGGVRLEKGIYRITAPIVVDLNEVGYSAVVGDGTARVVMAGEGAAFRFVGTHHGTAAPRTVKPQVWDNERMPIVDGLEIVGAHERACGIEATGTMQMIISRVNIRGTLHAVRLTERNRNVLIDSCHLYENRGAGLYLDDVNLHQINVSNCHISYNAGGGIVSRKGNVRNLHVGACDLEANHDAEGPATANILLDCRGGTHGIGEVAIVGCTIQHTHDAPDSANVRIIGNTRDDLREGHVTIGNNVMSDVQVNIDLQSVRGVTVTGNTLWKAHQRDFIATNCRDLIVTSNSLDRNPRYRVDSSASGGMAFFDCTHCIVSANLLSEITHPKAAMQFERCRRVNLTGCSVLDSEAGIFWQDVSDSLLANCLLASERPGDPASYILVVDGANNRIDVEDVRYRQGTQ